MRPQTITLLIVLGMTVLAAWFFSSYEKVQREEFVGYRGEAAWNEFLTAELLLQKAGIEADTQSTLLPSEWLPDTADTIVTRVTASLASAEQQGELLDWTGNGGHLVLLPPHQDTSLIDDFLQVIGFSFFMLDYAELDAGESPEHDSDEEAEEEYAYTFDLEYSLQRLRLFAEDEFEATLSDDRGYLAARRPWGDGYITVISDESLFVYAGLENYDHARFLLDVVDGYLPPGKVWFILDAAFPSLWELIWTHARLGVLAAALMLLLWLWSVMPRFGPPMASAPPERRSILEHVAAAGHFAWLHDGTAMLSQSSVRALVHEVDTQHPGFRRLSPDKQAKLLSKLSGIPAQDILDALTARDEPRHREFTRNAQILQRVRNRL